MSIIGSSYCRPLFMPNSNSNSIGGGFICKSRWKKAKNSFGVGASSSSSSMESSFDSSSSSSSNNLLHKMERAWLISQQPRPVACSSCDSNGQVECKWCGGTGFFILGDNMLCQVPSRNTSCIICAGKGSACCSDCKGTGFRAKWMEQPPMPK